MQRAGEILGLETPTILRARSSVKRWVSDRAEAAGSRSAAQQRVSAKRTFTGTPPAEGSMCRCKVGMGRPRD